MILVFGKTGQVGGELARNVNVKALSRADVDLLEPSHCRQIILDLKPTAVINAAAYTSVDKAEQEIDACFRINKDAPAEMAEACAQLEVPFVHISTDYVFDGHGEKPFSENDTLAPLNVYGRSKLDGEIKVAQAYSNSIILRTSWVFSSLGHNFVKTIRNLSQQKKQLSIVSDQFGSPTSAKSICDACLEIVRQKIQGNLATGAYHFSGSPYVSWAEFAEIICQKLNRETQIKHIRSHEYPTLAARPLNSKLDCTLIKQVFDIDPADWQKDLDEVLKMIG